MPWCTCPLGKVDGYVFSVQSQLWVHLKCKKPSKLVYEKFVKA